VVFLFYKRVVHDFVVGVGKLRNACFESVNFISWG